MLRYSQEDGGGGGGSGSGGGDVVVVGGGGGGGLSSPSVRRQRKKQCKYLLTSPHLFVARERKKCKQVLSAVTRRRLRQ